MCYAANVNCASMVGWYCRFMVYFVRASACVCGSGWSWSFQGDFNIYYCFPLLLDVSSEVNVSPICPHFSPPFSSSSVFVPLTAFFFSFHQPLSSPCYTPISEADWCFSRLVFLHPSLCFWNFSLLTFIAVFFKSVPPSFTLLHPQCPSSLSPSPYIPFKRPQLIYCVKSINCTQDFVLETHTCITLHWRTLACIWIVYWSSVYSRCHLGNSLASCFPLPPASLYCALTWHLWSFLVNRYSTLVHFSPNTHCVCPWGLTDFYDIL